MGSTRDLAPRPARHSIRHQARPSTRDLALSVRSERAPGRSPMSGASGRSLGMGALGRARSRAHPRGDRIRFGRCARVSRGLPRTGHAAQTLLSDPARSGQRSRHLPRRGHRGRRRRRQVHERERAGHAGRHRPASGAARPFADGAHRSRYRIRQRGPSQSSGAGPDAGSAGCGSRRLSHPDGRRGACGIREWWFSWTSLRLQPHYRDGDQERTRTKCDRVRQLLCGGGRRRRSRFQQGRAHLAARGISVRPPAGCQAVRGGQ